MKDSRITDYETINNQLKKLIISQQKLINSMDIKVLIAKYLEENEISIQQELFLKEFGDFVEENEGLRILKS